MCVGCSKQPLDQISSRGVYRDAGHRVDFAEHTARQVESHVTAGKRACDPVDVRLGLVFRW